MSCHDVLLPLFQKLGQQLTTLPQITFSELTRYTSTEPGGWYSNPLNDEATMIKVALQQMEQAFWKVWPTSLRKLQSLRAANRVSFRLLPSPEDEVAADNTHALLNALARAGAPDLTFSLVGTGDPAEIFLVVTTDKSFAPKLEQLLQPFFPHAALEPEDWATVPAEFTLAQEYSINGAQGFLARPKLKPDPLALFCNTMEQLKTGEAASLQIQFCAPPAGSHFNTYYRNENNIPRLAGSPAFVC